MFSWIFKNQRKWQKTTISSGKAPLPPGSRSFVIHTLRTRLLASGPYLFATAFIRTNLTGACLLQEDHKHLFPERGPRLPVLTITRPEQRPASRGGGLDEAVLSPVLTCSLKQTIRSTCLWSQGAKGTCGHYSPKLPGQLCSIEYLVPQLPVSKATFHPNPRK